nr:DUF975 family protein [Sedimentibacter sp.]
MWTREELKTRAKSVLKDNYWKALLISIVITLSSVNGDQINYNINDHRVSFEGLPGYIFNRITDYTFDSRDFFIIAIGLVLSTIAFRILIGFSLEVGGRKYFIQSARRMDNKKCFTFAFIGQNYTHIIAAMIRKAIYNFLWTLLLIIPGIIKHYEYRMVPYILADNPNIGSKESIKLSMDMTEGHKFNMFVLDLSFIGWIILGALALGVGIYFVNPYIFATEAELYLVLRNNAIEGKYNNYEKLLLNNGSDDSTGQDM